MKFGSASTFRQQAPRRNASGGPAGKTNHGVTASACAPRAVRPNRHVHLPRFTGRRQHLAFGGHVLSPGARFSVTARRFAPITKRGSKSLFCCASYRKNRSHFFRTHSKRELCQSFGQLHRNCRQRRHPEYAEGMIRDRYKRRWPLRSRIMRERISGMTQSLAEHPSGFRLILKRIVHKDRVLALRAGGKQRHRRLDQFLDAADVFDRLRRQIGPGARAARSSRASLRCTS